MKAIDPFDFFTQPPAGSPDQTCNRLSTVCDRPAGVTTEICVRSRRNGGTMVKARSSARSYRRAQAGKTRWGFGDVVVSMGVREITFTNVDRTSITWRITP